MRRRRRRPGDRERIALLLAPVLVALLVAGCGNRLPHEEIVEAAAGGGRMTVSNDGTVAGPTDEVDDGLDVVEPGDGGPDAGAASGQAGTSGTSAGVDTGSGDAGSGDAGSGDAGAATGGAGGSGGGSAPRASTILLGNVGTYSGPVGASTAAAQTALKVWESHINAKGGLGGHPVKVISADDQSDPAKTRALVRDMVENKKVVAFVGNQLALTAEAPRAYLEEKKVPAVGGDLTPVWHQSPMYFAQGSSLDTVVLGVARAAFEVNKKKIAVLYCAEAAVCTTINNILVDGGAKSQGASVAYSARISLAQPDFTSECISARNAGADSITVAADVGTVNRVAASCARQSYRPQFINTGNTVNGPQEDNPNLAGMITTQNWFGWASTTGAAAEYRAAMKRYAPDLPSTSGTAAVWSSGQLLARALRDVGPAPVTSQVILEGLWKLKNETLDGLAPPLTFRQGKPSQAARCYFAQQIRDGRWMALDGGKVRCLA